MSQKETNTENNSDIVELPVKRTSGETIKERLTGNAYHKILPARYLRKNKDGEIVETQEELFERVAKNLALGDLIYEANTRNITIEVKPNQVRLTHNKRHKIVNELFETDAKTENGELIVDNPDETIELTERNINKFSYDSIVPEVEDELRAEVQETKEEFEEMLSRLKFVPNSPTWMNAGDSLQQLSACFVISPDDDMDDIHETAKKAASVFKSGGGMGYGFWKLRPYGDPVGGSGGISSGPITFMRTYDQLCGTVAQGGTRRGAQMGVMRISHPDVIQFIHAKDKDVSLAHTLKLNDPDDYTHNKFKDALEEARELIDDEGRVPKHLRNAVEGHLSNFNISVGITDEFMRAVENEEEFTFTNPRTGEPHIATEQTVELYELYGLGEYVEEGEILSVPADEIWQDIIEGAHENGEPGVVFLERINKDNSFDVEKNPERRIYATNPCGEEPLSEHEACNLGHINLSTIVSEDAEYQDWRAFTEKYENSTGGQTPQQLNDTVKEFLNQALDWDELGRRIDIGTHMLDNVVTMSDFPVEEIDETVHRTRKIGLGVMGLAQLYIQLGVKYGSDVGNEIARQLMTYINHRSKSMSHELAEERGVFEEWDNSKYSDPTEYKDWFRHHVGKDPTDYQDGFEIRNHKTTTVAPTGTTSMLGNTSGGIEPIYNVAYYKNVSEDVQGDEMLVEFDDYFLRVLEANNIDIEKVKKEAEHQMSRNEFDGISGLETVPDEIGELFVTTDELTSIEHASVQCACQEGVDAAISKTINAPNEASVEETRRAFEYIYKEGGKGVTYYRDGTRSKQVITTRAENKSFSDEDTEEAIETIIEIINKNEEAKEQVLNELNAVPKKHRSKRPRPDVLSGTNQRINTGYGRMYVNINVDEDGDPFEVFINIGNSGGYTNSFVDSLAKVTSLALRSGAKPEEIADELIGTRSPKVGWDNGEKIHSIPDAVGKALKRVIEGEVEVTNTTGNTKNTPKLNEDKTNGEKEEVKEIKTSDIISDGESPECPECKSMSLYYSEGCKTCESCGWSEC